MQLLRISQNPMETDNMIAKLNLADTYKDTSMKEDHYKIYASETKSVH